MNGAPTGTGSDPGWMQIAQMQGQTAALQAGPLQVAQQQQREAAQASLGDDTLNLVKMFGARMAMSGASVNAPFTSTAGGFANPFLTPAGAMVGLRSA